MIMVALAQLVERWVVIPEAVGSSPTCHPKCGVENRIWPHGVMVSTRPSQGLSRSSILRGAAQASSTFSPCRRCSAGTGTWIFTPDFAGSIPVDGTTSISQHNLFGVTRWPTCWADMGRVRLIGGPGSGTPGDRMPPRSLSRSSVGTRTSRRSRIPTMSFLPVSTARGTPPAQSNNNPN